MDKIGLGQRSFLISWIMRALPEFGSEELWEMTEDFDDYDRRRFLAMLYEKKYEEIKRDILLKLKQKYERVNKKALV
jgi:hypothetical protein